MAKLATQITIILFGVLALLFYFFGLGATLAIVFISACIALVWFLIYAALKDFYHG